MHRPVTRTTSPFEPGGALASEICPPWASTMSRPVGRSYASSDGVFISWAASRHRSASVRRWHVDAAGCREDR